MSDLYDAIQCRKRLDLAKQALVATEYFTKEQVTDDVAPRIAELGIFLRTMASVIVNVPQAQTLMDKVMQGTAQASRRSPTTPNPSPETPTE